MPKRWGARDSGGAMLTMTRPMPTLRRLLIGLVAATSFAHAAPEPTEVAAVYEAAGLRQHDGAWRLASCPTPLKPSPESIALAPGQAGLLVYLGPSRCFAETQGGNVALYAKAADGRWTQKLDFVPGVEVARQATSNLGWPDLGVANPGGCMPIYRYDGERYRRVSQKALQPGGCQFRQ